MSKYFHDLEFLACTPSCNIAQMDKQFLEELDELREACGFPLVLNCAYRSKQWDLSKGRSGNSYHTKGRAVDVRCFDNEKRAIIVRQALRFGFTVGVYPRFIHIDNRDFTSRLFYGV